MKPYREYVLGSVMMHDSSELRALLRDVIAHDRIEHVVETGTHEGLGSTRFLAESFADSTPPRTFVTIEASWRYWRRARRNLRRFSFVTPLWGQSLDLRKAMDFVQHDDCIRHHERFPDIFIDDVTDPVAFYTQEIGGDLGGTLPPRRRLRRAIDRVVYYSGENLLTRSLRRVRDRNPLVVLDSAGGTGWLEFSALRAAMDGRSYLLLLDDVHHIKHFRSLEQVRRDPAFAIIGLDERHGWMLARHEGRAL